MEIAQKTLPKKLHHHAVPIVIITLAVMVVSTALVAQQNTLSGGGSSIVSDLFRRTLEVKPTSNGFAHVSLNRNNEQVSPEVGQAGRTVELIFTFHRQHL